MTFPGFAPVGALPLAAALLWPTTWTVCAEESGPHRPNIVLILADDMGYSDPGCYVTDALTDNAIDYNRDHASRRKDDPFFFGDIRAPKKAIC